MKISAKIAGIDELRERLNPESLQSAFFISLRQAQQEVFNEAVVLADKHTKSGAMRDSVRIFPVKRGDTQAIIKAGGPGAPYAIYVHEGTRPHEIRPREKKALRWATSKGQGKGFIFAKKVNHPGYKGDPFMYRAFEERHPHVLEIFREAFTEALT